MRGRNVLFLCTGNSARSILAECYLNALGKGRFVAYSAGSRPVREVNRYALELLRAQALDTSTLRSKSWDEFARPDAAQMDFIFTVCDGAAGEVCPVWPGRPASAHWGIDDPAAAQGGDAGKRAAFETAYRRLTARIDAFLALPLEQLDPEALRNRLEEIGRLPR